MNRTISVCHKSASPLEKQAKQQLIATGEQLKNQPGFLHYRLLEPAAHGESYVLLTFWQSAKHYRQVMG